jgi:hypothetical protein
MVNKIYSNRPVRLEKPKFPSKRKPKIGGSKKCETTGISNSPRASSM